MPYLIWGMGFRRAIHKLASLRSVGAMSAFETKTQTTAPTARRISLHGLATIIFVCGAGLAMLGWIGFLTWILLAILGF
jgi:hypothetical protein